MTQDAIAWLEIDALRTAIEKGSLSAAQVADHFLARIAELDPKLQAYSVVYEHRARATAARLDAAQAKGEPLGPLHGVAVALFVLGRYAHTVAYAHAKRPPSGRANAPMAVAT